MFKNRKIFSDNIDSFLDSLNFWQQINLCTTFQMASSDISYKLARENAIEIVGDESKLHYMLEEAINSPVAKSDAETNHIRKIIKQNKKMLDDLNM